MSLLRRAARSRLMARDENNHPDEDVLEGMSFQEFGEGEPKFWRIRLRQKLPQRS
jgi:hypothetical protein